MRTFLISLACLLCVAGVAHADVYVPNPNGASITVYATTSAGNVAPVRTIAGPATGLDTSYSLAIDNIHHELFVADFQGEAVRVFDLDADGNAAPLRTLVNGPNSKISQVRSVAVDLVHDEIVVLSFTDSIRTFPRTAGGDIAPLRTIAGSDTRLHNPFGLAIDPAHDEILVTTYPATDNSTPGGILAFSRLADGNSAPLRAIGGANVPIPYATMLALDAAHDELYTFGDSGLLVFPRTADGDVAPIRSLSAVLDLVHDVGPRGILVDNVNDRLIVTRTDESDTRPDILVFERLASGNVAPLLTIAGPATGLHRPEQPAMDAAGGFTVIAATTPSVPIPSLGRWAILLIVLALWLAGAAAIAQRRRHRFGDRR